MTRSTLLLIATAFPSSALLLYLATHATEGWQLLVVALFASGFVCSWLKRSQLLLAASYVVTLGLCGVVIDAYV